MHEQSSIRFKAIDGAFIQRSLFGTLSLAIGLILLLFLLMPETVEDGALVFVLVPLLGWMFAAVWFSSAQYELILDASGIRVTVTKGGRLIRTGKQQDFRWDEIASYDVGTDAGNDYIQLKVKGKGISPRWQKIAWEKPGLTTKEVNGLFATWSGQFAAVTGQTAPEQRSVWATPAARIASVVLALVLIALPVAVVVWEIPVDTWHWVRFGVLVVLVLGYLARVWGTPKK